MQPIFTPELLVKHLYNETNEQEAIAINRALATDVTIKQEFTSLQEARYALDEADGEIPGASVIEKIRAFSKEKELAASH